MVIAGIQLNSTDNGEENLKKVFYFLERALKLRPDIIVLPEYTNYMGSLKSSFSHALPKTSEWYEKLSGFARINRVGLIIGLLLKGTDKKSTSSLVYFDNQGILRHTYNKLHLFDVVIDKKVSYCESAYLMPGNKPGMSVINEIPCGFALCYDLRFPEVFRFFSANKRRIIFLPSAFTETTGKDHWEVLVRARAIENQVFMIAINQVGIYDSDKASYGKSMIVDPWGTILAQAPGMEESENECIISASPDFTMQDHVRKKIPCLLHRRRDLFE
ncbi:MAG: hypothetical protein JXJ04_14375 [Spirochaetales bacterium]|nr:hypothetical protein [Spirochaetales bacterium]